MQRTTFSHNVALDTWEATVSQRPTFTVSYGSAQAAQWLKSPPLNPR